MTAKSREFYPQLKNAKKVLFLDLGALGDSVHLIPSLWQTRLALPEIELHVMVAEHAKSLFSMTPWIDKTMGYPRQDVKPGLWSNLKRIWAMRKEKYDAIINLNGSQRSSFLTLLSGSPLRLGRVHQLKRKCWGLYYTHMYWEDYEQKPVFSQRLAVLKQAGFPEFDREIDIQFSSEVNHWVLSEGFTENEYLHLSPFASQDYKELPNDQLITLINHILATNAKLVLSCSSHEREEKKLNEVLNKLNAKPWKVYQGNIDISQLSAIIKHSQMHIGADSGSLHLANIFKTPSLSWFRKYSGMKEWMPQGETHHSLVGTETPTGISGISQDDLHACFEKMNKKKGD